jgi:hypothetical protein
MTALGALGSSAVVVEVRRSLMRQGWTDQVHFRWILFWAVVLFVLQFTGINQAIGPVLELL